MLRRLPLLGTTTPEMPDLGAQRTWLGPASIGIADTDMGQLAVRFGVDLAIAFAGHATKVTLSVLGYQGVPTLDAALVAELTAIGISPTRREVPGDRPFVLDPSSHESQSAAVTASDASHVALFVGLPALGACRPALSLLLGADRPLTGWPPVLRGVRGELALSLAVARPGLATLLATALIERGFLPRG